MNTLIGDRQTYMIDAYTLPCKLVTVRGDVQTVKDTDIRVEVWINPHTGVPEPFYGVTLDGKGRLYETQAQMTAVQVVPDDAPDWGGLNMEPLDLDISIPIAWVLTLLAAAMSLSLLVWWLRTYR